MVEAMRAGQSSSLCTPDDPYLLRRPISISSRQGKQAVSPLIYRIESWDCNFFNLKSQGDS